MDVSLDYSAGTYSETIRIKITYDPGESTVPDVVYYFDIEFLCQVTAILESGSKIETIAYTLNGGQHKVSLCTDIDLGLIQEPACGHEFTCVITSVDIPVSLEGALSWEGSSLFIESSNFAHVGTHSVVISTQANFDGEITQVT